RISGWPTERTDRYAWAVQPYGRSTSTIHAVEPTRRASIPSLRHRRRRAMADPTCILGIDPGKSGGVVAFYEGCHMPALLRAMPDTPRELFDCVQHNIGPVRAYIEHVTTQQMSTGASPTGNFKLGWSL